MSGLEDIIAEVDLDITAGGKKPAVKDICPHINQHTSLLADLVDRSNRLTPLLIDGYRLNRKRHRQAEQRIADLEAKSDPRGSRTDNEEPDLRITMTCTPAKRKKAANNSSQKKQTKPRDADQNKLAVSTRDTMLLYRQLTWTPPRTSCISPFMTRWGRHMPK